MTFDAPIPSVFPARVDSDRIRLRELTEGDFDKTWSWASNEEFFRFLPFAPPTIEEQRAWFALVIAESLASPRRQYQLGIEPKQVGELVGIVRIGIERDRSRSASIGYGINPVHAGQGYATEATRMLVGFGFETLGMHRIFATHHPDNSASRRVLDKVGFCEEGRLRDDRISGGAWADSVICSILEDDWNHGPATA